MRLIKVNIREQRKRFNQLMDAIMKREKMEGCYVVSYSEVKEAGERYALFRLSQADDESANYGT